MNGVIKCYVCKLVVKVLANFRLCITCIIIVTNG